MQALAQRLRSDPPTGAALARAVLAGAYLAGACLAGACLAGACLAGACLAAGVPEAASAQTGAESPAARREPDAVPRVVFAGGVDADGRGVGSGYPPQLALHLGYQVLGGERVGGPRLGLRLGLDYTASNSGPRSTRDDLPFDSRRARAVGVALLGTFAPTRGPVRPYLIGGPGLYTQSSATTYPAVYLANAFTTPGSVPPPPATERASWTGLGLTAGAGLAVPVGRVVLFGEARGTLLGLAVLSDTPGIRGTQLPLVVGVRF